MPDPAQPIERKLAAIFAADVAGYSRLMGQDEVGTLRTLAAHREIMDRLIGEHRGRIANTAGDSVLAEFPSVVDAVQCAVQVQEALAEANEGVPEDRRMSFRIGVHMGDVMIRNGDLLGDGVNVAARLQALAHPGGVCLSGEAHQYARKVLPLAYADLGHQTVRNIEEPIRAYALEPVRLVGSETGPPEESSQTSSLPDRPSIAVLPFENMSGSPEDEYFADGITEDLITALTRVRWVQVVARNSVFGYKRKAQDIRQVARDLRATYMLEGSVRREAGRVKLTAQLIDGTTGTHIWAKRYDRSLEDIFAVQDDLTERIFAAVMPELGEAERERARAKRPDSLTAWDCYQRGLWHLYRRTRDDVAEAERLFERALKLEGNLVPALCALAEAHYFQGLFFQPTDVVTHRAEAMRLAERAVDLDHQDPAAYCALARAHMMNGDHSAAASFAETALSLNPTSSRAQYLLGISHTYAGRPREGLPHLELAIKLSPYDEYAGRFMAAIAEAHLFLGEHDKAAEWGSRALRQPRSGHTSRRQAVYAAALAHGGLTAEARKVVQDLVREWPDLTIGLLCQSVPSTAPDYLSCYAEGLRKAGLPE